MPAKWMVAIVSVLPMAGCAAFPDKSSVPAPTCRSDEDCRVKWAAARTFVLSHAKFPIETELENQIATAKPSAGSGALGLAAEVNKVVQPDGSYAIEAKFWCENIFRCTPNAVQTMDDFNRSIAAAGAGLVAVPPISSIAAESLLAAAAPAVLIGVKIAVTDYPKAIDFYTRLGFKVGDTHGGTELDMASDDPLGLRLVLIRGSSGQASRAPGGAHLVIRVRDVETTAKALKEAGYAVGEPTTTGNLERLTAQDPDGDEVEIRGSPPG
jgi:catechol 2,3-dioxygenase-like lactoylglutathione lyase family enzyme